MYTNASETVMAGDAEPTGFCVTLSTRLLHIITFYFDSKRRARYHSNHAVGEQKRCVGATCYIQGERTLLTDA